MYNTLFRQVHNKVIGDRTVGESNYRSEATLSFTASPESRAQAVVAHLERERPVVMDGVQRETIAGGTFRIIISCMHVKTRCIGT